MSYYRDETGGHARSRAFKQPNKQANKDKALAQATGELRHQEHHYISDGRYCSCAVPLLLFSLYCCGGTVSAFHRSPCRVFRVTKSIALEASSSSCSNEIIAAKQSGALLLPAAVLKQYSDVNGWESYVLATGREHTEDVFNLAANDGHRERMTDSIVRGVQGMSQVVWRTQEVCKSASTLVDDNIAVLEQQLAIAREAKEKVNGVSATLLENVGSAENTSHPV